MNITVKHKRKDRKSREQRRIDTSRHEMIDALEDELCKVSVTAGMYGLAADIVDGKIPGLVYQPK